MPFCRIEWPVSSKRVVFRTGEVMVLEDRAAGRRLELLAAVTPRHAIPNDHSPGVDEPGRAAHLGEHLVPHLHAEEGVGPRIGMFAVTKGAPDDCT